MVQFYLLVIPVFVGIIAGMFLAFYPETESESSSLTVSNLIDGGSPILGNSNAPITILEWGDFNVHFVTNFTKIH